MSASTVKLLRMARSSSSSSKISTDYEGIKENNIKIAEIFRKGIKLEEVLAFYDEWSENYEEVISKGWYSAPVIALEEILRRIPRDDRAAIRVLDVGAGTGWIGPNLYRHIDALEPSKGMLKKLMEKGVYTSKFAECIGTGHCSVPAGTYDVLISAGGWGEGHLPVCAMDEFVRVSKKGGLAILVMRPDNMTEAYKEKLEPYMEELERKGAWTKVEKRVVPNFSHGSEGVMYIFRVA